VSDAQSDATSKPLDPVPVQRRFAAFLAFFAGAFFTAFFFAALAIVFPSL
jgi:hypothetical protein